MNTVEFPSQDKVRQEAATWISKMDRGLSDIEEEKLVDWLQGSAAHQRALVDYAGLWDMLDVLNPISKLLPMTTSTQEPSATTVEPKIQAGTGGLGFAFSEFSGQVAMISATIALLVGGFWLAAGGSYNDSGPTDTVTNQTIGKGTHYRSKVGENMRLSLNDGSKLELNTDTEISVEFSEASRVVRVIRGEVYFDVAKNKDRPFVAIVDEGSVTAVGTEFNIEVSELHGTEVIVTEGRVKVDRFGEKADDVAINVEPPVFLSEGQKVLISDGRAEVSPVISFTQALAWKDGVVVFNGESLDQVVREIDRYTPLTFEIVDKEVASLLVGGVFKTGDLDQLLLVLEQNFGVVSTQIDQKILLSKAN